MKLFGEVQRQKFGSLRFYDRFVLGHDAILEFPELAQRNVVSIVHTDDHKAGAPKFVVRADTKEEHKTVGGGVLFEIGVKGASHSVRVSDPAPFAGTVDEILVEGDGVIISKGQPVFRITPDEKIVIESPEERNARRRDATAAYLGKL